jgi:hypothetical protein
MAFQEIKVPDNASIAQKGLAWVDSRFPLSKMFKEHMSEYYAPKNFNFWYFFGSLGYCCFSDSDCDWNFPGHELQTRCC